MSAWFSKQGLSPWIEEAVLEAIKERAKDTNKSEDSRRKSKLVQVLKCCGGDWFGNNTSNNNAVSDPNFGCPSHLM